MDTSALVASFATGSYTVTRRARTTSATRGVINDGAETTISGVRASVSPARGADLLKVPEGRRTSETKTIYTTTRLYVDPTEGYEADRITIGGNLYELVFCEIWNDSSGGVPAYHAVAVRM